MGKETLLRALLEPINPAATILLGIYTFVWGAWVAWPWTDVFGQAQLYNVLSSIAPEMFWGILAIVTGIVIVYGAWVRSYRSLVFGAAVGAWHWTMIAVFYFLGDSVSTGGITSLAIATYSVYVYLNLRVNHKYIKTREKILHYNNDCHIM